MKTEEKKKMIREKALEILKENKYGVRYSELVRKIQNIFPDLKIKLIQWSVWDLDRSFPDKVYKPERGLFRLKEYSDLSEEINVPTRIEEEKFYKPFADWLVNELEEATKAISLGGNKFKDKWGTPDVIGIRESTRSDIIKIPTEVISAEIKLDTNNLITAFGQACAYRVFSHKVYLLIPKQSPETDISRLDSLCLIFGIGLVLFDANDPGNPKFEIRVRPIKHEPDVFYTNKYLKQIENELFG
jgi:hypothetical protein